VQLRKSTARETVHSKLTAASRRDTPGSEFLHVLGIMAGFVQRTGHCPLIHIECHGLESGLILANGDHLPYEELASALRKLNHLTRNNLFVVVSACFGAYLMDTIQLGSSTPVWGLSGPLKPIAADRLKLGYYAFYSSLLKTLDTNAACEEMNAALLPYGERIQFVSSALLFMLGFRYYLADHCNENAVRERVADILSRALNGGMHPSLYDWVKKHAFSELGTHERQLAYFETLKTKFFLADIYPENAKRFAGVSFDDMLKARVVEKKQ